MASAQWQIDARMKLHHAVNLAGGQAAFARRHGLPNTKLLNDVLWGRKNASPDLAAIVGVMPPVVVVRPKIERAAAPGCVDWSEHRIAYLRKLWSEGLSTAQIARQMNLTKNAIVGKAHRLGLDSRPSPIKTREPGYVPRQRRAPRAGKVTLPKPGRIMAEVICDHPKADRAVADLVYREAQKSAQVVIFKPRVYRATDCCWPTGDGPNIRFECDSPAVPGRPYCVAHLVRAYVPRSAEAAEALGVSLAYRGAA